MHYLIVIFVVLAIICLQILICRDSLSKIKKYKSIFPNRDNSFTIEITPIREDGFHEKQGDSDSFNEETETENKNANLVSQIKSLQNHPILNEIISSLNMYLKKNKGAASDFNLMKDVVERNCEAVEEEIDVQQPIPLYCGLMGTMIGIIVGIGFIAIQEGGLAGNALVENISILMACVAIAMFASLVGIVCTTWISWKSKRAKAIVEASKNKFYTWIQTELLPVLSGNTATALAMLQQNLITFNESFGRNVKEMDLSLSQVKDNSKDTIEMLDAIKRLDIVNVSKANIKVLKELQQCTDKLALFNHYINNVTEYLEAVRNLNENINNNLDRTATIERMGAFFEQEINQVQERKQYISQAVADVDNNLRKTFEALTEGTNNSVNELRNNSAAEVEEIKRALEAQHEEFVSQLNARNNSFSDFMRNQQDVFNNNLKEQQEALIERSSELEGVIKELQKLSELKNSINNLVNATGDSNKRLERIIENTTLRKETEKQDKNSSGSKFLVVFCIIVGVGCLLVFAMFGYEFIINHFI